MAQAIPMAAATALQVGGTLLGARDEARALKKEAKQLDVKAGLERASSQREAIEERRQADIAQSRTLALAAASGGGATDPTVINIMADLAGEGEYRALTSLYQGEEEARGLEDQAKSRRKEAKGVKRAALFKSAGTLLKAGSSMQDRYG